MLSSPRGTEMFQFPRLPSRAYRLGPGFPIMTSGGLPHSGVSGSLPACGSPELFAACRALHRPLLPRHPPRALSSLITPDLTALARAQRRRRSLDSLSASSPDRPVRNGPPRAASRACSSRRSYSRARLRALPTSLLLYPVVKVHPPLESLPPPAGRQACGGFTRPPGGMLLSHICRPASIAAVSHFSTHRGRQHPSAAGFAHDTPTANGR